MGQRERELGRRVAVRAQDVPDDGGILADADGSTADASCRAGHERGKKVRRVEDDPTDVEQHAPLKGDLAKAVEDSKRATSRT